MKDDANTLAVVPLAASRIPFSFTYGDSRCKDCLEAFRRENSAEELDENRTRSTTLWSDPDTGLKIRWEATRYADFPALEWLIWFENSGAVDSKLIQGILSLDLTFEPLKRGDPAYRLHRTKGGICDPTDFESRATILGENQTETMRAAGGRSSNGDFPFFKIESDCWSVIIAVGWSGQWVSRVERLEDHRLRVTAGMERTCFRLHPGEKVRSPRILLLYWEGATLECNARFRRLIYKHYAAVKGGTKPLPTLYCNTAFTRKGHWLNECNAENQISLIHAYGPLGLEAIVTDAGWFEGGWPKGAGNWTPRKEAYPEGMGPVAAAAKSQGMIYGLWFEMERVVSGTWLHQHHPEWLLGSGEDPQQTWLLNLGLPEVRDYLLGIVSGFMDLPGFRVYRQDFNMDPLPYWLHSDTPDRQGMTEINYIQGLYDFWERISEAWPDSLRIECAAGGRRIDLETVMRMHVHQKSDYWFDDEVDQASIWGLSQYLPNNVFMTPLDRMDDYSFHSALATSLCLGWIADAPDFDRRRAAELLETYRKLCPFLIGDWYPLLPYSRDPSEWIAFQFHRSDLDEGMILVFRRPKCSKHTVELPLHGLDAGGIYALSFHAKIEKMSANGVDLMRGLRVALPNRRQSDLIRYCRMGRRKHTQRIRNR